VPDGPKRQKRRCADYRDSRLVQSFPPLECSDSGTVL
jgi:hypothetical protein